MSLPTLVYLRLKSLAANPFTILLMLLLPAATGLMFGAMAAHGGASIPIAVVDEDGSQYAQMVLERLESRPALRVMRLDRSSAERSVKRRQAEAAVIIPKGFQQRVIANELKASVQILKSPASLSAELVGEYVASEVIRLSSSALAANQVTEEYLKRTIVSPAGSAKLWQEAWSYSNSFWEPEPLMTMRFRDYGSAVSGAPDPSSPSRGGENALFGLTASLALFNMLLSAGVLVQERSYGLFPRIRLFSTGTATYLGSSAVAIAAVGLGTWLIALASTRWLAGISPGLSPENLALVAAYLLAGTGLSLAAGTMLKHAEQLQLLAPLAASVTGILGSGAPVLRALSPRFELLARLTPQGWLIIGLERQSPFPSTVVLVLVTAGLLAFTGAWSACRRA